MEKLKKILAYFLCVIFVLSVLPIIAFAIDEYDNVPAIIQSEGTFIIGEGAVIEGVLGSTALTDQAHLPGYSSGKPAEVQFTNPGLAVYGYFEFDYYADSIDTYSTRAVKLYFNVRSANNASRGTFEFQDQITQNGWNHIKIAADLDGDKLNSITKARFYMDKSAGLTGAADRYRIANICVTKDPNNIIPTVEETESVFVIGLGVRISGVLGSSALTGQAHLPGYSSSKPAEVQFTNPGLAGYEYFEFDYYVDDIDNFNARSIKLYLNVRAANNASQGTFEFQDQIIQSGWNHIRIPATISDDKLNIITKTRFYMDMDAGSAGAADNYKIANICVTKDAYGIVPVMPDYAGVFEIYQGAKFEGTLGDSALAGQAHLPGYSSVNPAEIQFTNPGLADYDYFEFDYYIDNITDFSARNIRLYLNVHDTADTSQGTFEFQDQITHSGWNHVKVAATLSDDKLNTITKTGFYMDMDAGATGVADRYRIANICATKDTYGIVPEMIQSENIFVIGSGAIIEGLLSDSGLSGQAHLPGYGSSNPAEKQYENPGLSDYGCFEFDYYVDSIDNFKARSIKLYLNLRAANDASQGTFEFQNQITQNGWNHVKVSTALSNDKLDIITKARFYMDMDAGSTGAADRYRIANICATKDTYGIVPEIIQSEDIFVISSGAVIEGTLGSSGLAGQAHLPGYNSISPAEIAFENSGLNNHGCFEFDYYVDSIENFNTRTTKLYFNIRDKKGSRGTFEFQKQIIQSGWNHIKIDASLDNDLLSSLTAVRFYMDIDAGSAGANDRYRVANIFASRFAVPDLPGNVVAQIGTLKSATLGDYFHTAENLLYEEKLEAVDFSRATAIEFDLYIDDYEALLAAEKASAENYSGLPYARESKLALYFSSTPANLWQQYSKPRKYFSVRIPLSDKITHNGWNHIVVGKSDFTANSQTIDWANLTGWMVAFIYGSDAHQEVNPYPNVTVSVCNIVNTGVVSNVPKDGDKETLPDKNSVYISNSESISDDNGTWNPGNVYIRNDYKSEGKASVALDLNYHSLVKDACIYYLFDETVDMRDLKTLKFDFFIDLPQFIQASGNKAEIVISNRRNLTGDFYKWDLDFSKLKTGWNSFELNVDSLTVSGKPDLGKCKVIMLRFTELNIDAAVFAEIVIGIDNLRYLSSAGSTVLKINDDSYEFEDQDYGYNGFSGAISDIDGDISDQEPADFVYEPQTKYLKTIRKLIVPDYLTSGIVLGSEAVIALAGVITFILIYRKKRKNSV